MQICYFVRGSSCAGAHVDYYLLPDSLHLALGPQSGQYTEQVVRVDWDVFTPAAIRNMGNLEPTYSVIA